MGEVDVLAEVIEDDLMISQSSFEIDMSGIQRDIEDLTGAIDAALTVYGELLVNPADIAALPADQARRCEREISSAIREADELRRKLNRDYRVPLDVAKRRYDELMGPVIELHAAYRQRRVDLDEAQKGEKMQAIRGLYESMAAHIALPAEEHDAALVPFDRIFAMFGAKWLNKGSSMESVERELAGIVGRILADERRLDDMALGHATEAKAVFWETLDADAAVARDRELCDLEQRQAARDAERAKDAQPGSPTADAAKSEAPAGRKPRVMLIEGATDDECRQIGQFCKSLGISGVFKGERFYDAVKAL